MISLFAYIGIVASIIFVIFLICFFMEAVRLVWQNKRKIDNLENKTDDMANQIGKIKTKLKGDRNEQ